MLLSIDCWSSYNGRFGQKMGFLGLTRCANRIVACATVCKSHCRMRNPPYPQKNFNPIAFIVSEIFPNMSRTPRPPPPPPPPPPPCERRHLKNVHAKLQPNRTSSCGDIQFFLSNKNISKTHRQTDMIT